MLETYIYGKDGSLPPLLNELRVEETLKEELFFPITKLQFLENTTSTLICNYIWENWKILGEYFIKEDILIVIKNKTLKEVFLCNLHQFKKISNNLEPSRDDILDKIYIKNIDENEIIF